MTEPLGSCSSIRSDFGMPGSNLPSTSRPQTCSNGYCADELLDVDTSIPERRAFLVGLRNLRLERDHAFEPWAEVVHVAHASESSPDVLRGMPCTCHKDETRLVRTIGCS